MRILGFLMILVLSIACKEQSKETKSDLINGKWEMTHINDQLTETSEGLLFSSNKQYFNIDSQGKPIPRLMEKVWQIKGDTLKMVDFNFEPKFINTKGTKIYLIETLNGDKMTLLSIKSKEANKISYKKIK